MPKKNVGTTDMLNLSKYYILRTSFLICTLKYYAFSIAFSHVRYNIQRLYLVNFENNNRNTMYMPKINVKNHDQHIHAAKFNH